MSKLKPTHDLSGLMNYAKHAPWDEAMDDALAAHLGPVSEQSGIAIGDVFDAIGDNWQGPIWGCAFEDLMGQTLAGQNLVDDYLKRRGWNEKPANKAYMKALRDAPMSIYEVSDVVPGEAMTLRDLVRGGPPVRVKEHSATRSLLAWDHIATRVVKVKNNPEQFVISGALLPFDADSTAQFMEVFAQLEAERNTEVGDEIAGRDAGDDDDRTVLLRQAAPLFTHIWLLNCLAKMSQNAKPDMVNVDGDRLEFHRIVFPLAKGVQAKSVARRLHAASFLEAASDTYWNWLTPQKAEHIFASSRDQSPNAQIFSTQMDDGTPVFAGVELAGRMLIVEVNSAERVAVAKRKMQGLLGDCVANPLTEIRTLEQVLADDAAREAEYEQPEISSDDAERIVHDMLTRQYKATLDQPIPALNGHSPRALAASKSGAIKGGTEIPNDGRKQVAQWLKHLENGIERAKKSGDPMGSYDVTWMWEELDLTDLRR